MRSSPLALVALWAAASSSSVAGGDAVPPAEERPIVTRPSGVTLLADLPPPPAEAADLAAAPDPLVAVGAAYPPYAFRNGPLTVLADPRWFRTEPSPGPGAPLLVLRRWPGDTVVAFYAIGRSPSSGDADQGDAAPAQPPVPAARFEAPAEVGPGVAARRGALTSELGERPALWIVRTPEGPGPLLAALVLPGDAGFGEAGIASLALEANAVALRARPGTGWEAVPSVPADRLVQVPTFASLPGAQNEREHPWQVVDGGEFTLGLPPGVRAVGAALGIAPPRPIEGQRLWLRGRFRDIEDVDVAIGDGRRAGYVARVESPTEAWREGRQAPLGAPGARRAAGEAFDLIPDRTGAQAGRAERWNEPGFDGSWIVFRIAFADRGYEIGLPVLEGRRSMSLYWIPATWRESGVAPAPPPVDPAARFGIRFERWTAGERRNRPWTEGFLFAPGLRVELPLDHWPSAALRTSDGFPIRILDGSGGVLGRIERIEAPTLRDADPVARGWVEGERPGRHGAAAWWTRGATEALFRATEGHGFALVAPELAEDDPRRELWNRMVLSVQLLKP